jgi:hypothetical protein
MGTRRDPKPGADAPAGKGSTLAQQMINVGQRLGQIGKA